MNKEEQLFAQLLYIFHSSGMQGLGKVMNPVTNKIERNLEQAKQSIDMIEMLRDKTKGNLSPESERLLTQFLSDLRLNYVDEVNNNKA
jgi:hypothetical protein